MDGQFLKVIIMLDDVSKNLSKKKWTDVKGIGQIASLNTEQKQRFKEFVNSVQTQLDTCGINFLDFWTHCRVLNPAVLSENAGNRFSKDYADLSEKDFISMLKSVDSIAELQGIALRQKYLNAPRLKKYSKWQIDLIKQRKWELEHG